MNPLGTRARAEELARLLEGAVSGPGLLTAGQLTLATRLRTLAPTLEVTPRPEFRAALRQRLVAVATVQASVGAPVEAARPTALDAAVSWTQSRKAQRRIGVLAGSMAGVIAVSGVGLASSRSLPGQPFYGLKKATESVELSFVSGDTAKGSKHLEFAATRLREVGALARGEGQLALSVATDGSPTASGAAFGGSLSSRIVTTLAAFDAETRSGQTLLESAYRSSQKSEPLQILKTFASSSQQDLTALVDTLPASARPSAQNSLELVFSVGSDARELLTLGACGGECYPGNAGPTLPTEPEPEPMPGATANPTPAQPDTNGVPDCQCAPSPAPAPTPEPSGPTPSPTPTASPEPTSTPSPSASPTASPTGTPGPLPTDLPTGLPTGLPTILPTILPTGLPTLLPVPLPTLLPLPTLAPQPQP